MQNAWNLMARRSHGIVGVLAALALASSTMASAGCDLGQVTVKTTAKVLRRAQPSIKQESDYEMAARAIPGALKTVEGFWVVRPQDENLQAILTEGYCQYGTAFVEDEWEVADFARKLDQAAYHNARATKMFTRCLNYALMQLGDAWTKDIFDAARVDARIARTGRGDRTPMMWAALALGSIINHNLNNIDVISNLGTVKKMLARVVELDGEGGKNGPDDVTLRALPHVALGMINSGMAVAMGGLPAVAKAEFETALKLTAAKDGTERYLLARVLMAYKVGRQTHDQKFFHDNLVKVLETPPSVWPEQRLANEVAHRRARRYLGMEKEIFQ